MSAIKWVTIVCDSFPHTCDDYDTAEQYTEAARQLAKQAGWTRRDSFDLCPDCSWGEIDAPNRAPWGFAGEDPVEP